MDHCFRRSERCFTVIDERDLVPVTDFETARLVGCFSDSADHGAVLGAGQGLVMMPYLDRSELWIALTAIGYAGGYIFPTLLKVDPLLKYGFLGLTLGAGQWLVLRHAVRSSIWWIGVNVACWLAVPLFGDGGALLYSPITGFAMMWLLNHPKQSVPLATSATQVN